MTTTVYLLAFIATIVFAQETTTTTTQTPATTSESVFKGGLSFGSSIVSGALAGFCLLIAVVVLIALIRGKANAPPQSNIILFYFN
jgi:uncharacterized membrane protein